MRKISNPRLINRNRQIGNFSQLGGIVVIIAGFAYYWFNQTQFGIAYGAMFLGLIFSQIGAAFTNKWGKIPPPDQAIDDLLKGLDDRYTIIHFRLKAEHVLFTPNGVLAIHPKYERGAIRFDGKKWSQTGVSGFYRFFGVEALGNPILDGEVAADRLNAALRRIFPKTELPPVRSAVVFVNERTQLDLAPTSLPVLHAAKFKDYVRKLPKAATLSAEQFARVLQYIGEKA